MGLYDVLPCHYGIDMPMGMHFTKWYGMLPPDRMHLWWEGMAKHVVEWFFALIDLNQSNGDVPWSTTILDEMLMNFDCQHSDKDVPTHRFHSGAANLKKIPAKHVLPLIVQLQVLLGCDYQFVTQAQHNNAHDILATMITLGWLLHLDEYTDSDLTNLGMLIRK